MKTRDQLVSTSSVKKPRIKVLGLGGGGCNTINRLSLLGFEGILLAAANTDAQTLAASRVEEKITLGSSLTRGLGSGGDPVIGRRAAEESYRELISCIKGSDLLFLTAGIGGGTGSGAIEIAARIARSLDIMTIAVVTLPFSFESGSRSFHAMEAVAHLRPFADTLVTIPNDRLLSLADNHTSLSAAFSLADDLLIKSIQGLSSIIRSEGILSVDISHVLRLMRQEGGSYISSGIGSGENRVIEALDRALRHPLLEEIPVASAAGMIVKLAGQVSVMEIQTALEYLKTQTSEEIEIITAVSENNLLAAEGQIQAMVMVTGIGGVGLMESNFSSSSASSMIEKSEDVAIPVSGTFPKVGYTNAEPNPDNLEVPAFIRNSYNRLTV
ncbi:MAG: cell division protein FtsZ [Chloroflexi bacterium]|nr:cell division protein FtsZ [Chloroflexota bacterium]